ncbi:serine/threonine protein kinase [Metabacillus sp. HB246100]
MRGLCKKIVQITERPLKDGTIINGRFTICRWLGKGSFGFTYIVKEHSSGNLYVLKQLRKHKMMVPRADHHSLLQREGNILKELDHEAFPTIIDEFTYNNKHFLVMELIHGKTYEEIIFADEIKFSEIESFKELLKILFHIKYLHDKEYVHRDLRIPNIIKRENHVFIIDFGLARKISEYDEDLDKASEEKKLFREVSFKSDFYALGHFLLFLLYSSYEPTSNKKRTWEEELNISVDGARIIRKLLQIEPPYEYIDEVIRSVETYIKANEVL